MQQRPRAGGAVTALGEPQTLTVTADPGVTLTPAQRTAAAEYHGRVDTLQRAFTGALEQANSMRAKTQAIQRALVDSPADVKLMDEARRFDQRVVAILRELRKGLTAQEVRDALGEPGKVELMATTAGPAEVWTYRFSFAGPVSEVQTGETTYVRQNPITGAEETIHEPVYSIQQTMIEQTLSLLFCEGRLTEWKQSRETRRRWLSEQSAAPLRVVRI